MTLGEAKALLAKGTAPKWHMKEAAAIESLFAASAQALASMQEVFRDLADGRLARNIVINAAERALSENKADQELCLDLREVRDEFIASFAVIAADATLTAASRTAISGAIVRALLIGSASKSPELVGRLEKEFQQATAALARLRKAEKSAARQAEILSAVRAAMKRTPAKATRGDAFARYIQPEVEKCLGRAVSISTVRNAVRVTLKRHPENRVTLKEAPCELVVLMIPEGAIWSPRHFKTRPFMSHKFPSPVQQQGRMYFWRNELEAYKRALAGLPPTDNPNAVDMLVPAAQAASEFGFGRRTLGRRVAASQPATVDA